MKISAVIITFNEEKNIAAAVASVGWADEILVVDSGSTDKTRDIAEKVGAKVIVRSWAGFSVQKQFAADAAENDWIFSLDADERVSAELQAEILEIKRTLTMPLAVPTVIDHPTLERRGAKSSPILKPEGELKTAGYRIPRLSFYMDRPIRHGGWYPDWQLRLFDRSKGKWKDVLIHESFEMAAGTKIAKLTGNILHYSVENAAHHNRMIGERYAPLAARQMFENGRRTSVIGIIFAGWIAFVQTYFIKLGFLDGFPGFCIAYFAAHHSFMKHLMLWELQKTRTVTK